MLKGNENGNNCCLPKKSDSERSQRGRATSSSPSEDVVSNWGIPYGIMPPQPHWSYELDAWRFAWFSGLQTTTHHSRKKRLWISQLQIQGCSHKAIFVLICRRSLYQLTAHFRNWKSLSRSSPCQQCRSELHVDGIRVAQQKALFWWGHIFTSSTFHLTSRKVPFG